MVRLTRIRALVRKELIQVRRDRRLLGILVIAPVFQLVVLGFAASTDVRDVRLLVRDDDRTPASRAYVRALGASGFLRPRPAEGAAADDPQALVAGRAGLVLQIPPGFGRRLAAGEPAPVQALVDGADSNYAVQGLNHVTRATRLFAGGAGGGDGAGPAVEVEARAWYNPDLLSRRYMLPGIMGVLLLVTTLLVTAMAFVKEREDGTFEQLVLTPLRPMEIIVGKLVPYGLIGLVELSLVLPVIVLVFDLPVRGSVTLLYFFVLLFLMSTLGLGLWISLRVQSQQQALLVSSFAVMMPFTMLSGFIFPVANMPELMRPIVQFIPLTHFMTAVRGIVLKGAGLRELAPQADALFVLGSAFLAAAVLSFHKRAQ